MTVEPADPLEPGRRDRGFRERKREDHALALIDELRASLADLAKTRRILLELGRYYDPVLGGPIMAIEHQRAILRALGDGRTDAAHEVIQTRYELYIRHRAHLGPSSTPGPPPTDADSGRPEPGNP